MTVGSLQTVVLGILMRSIGNKNTILLGLGFQILQLAWYGFGSQPWSVTPTPSFVVTFSFSYAHKECVGIRVRADFFFFFLSFSAVK